MSVWRKFGLTAPGWAGMRNTDPRYAALPRSTRFRLALEEKGGLFALFGQYLAGRADLLTSPTLKQMRQMARHREPFGPPPPGREPFSRLSDVRPLRVAPASDVYACTVAGRDAVVELFPSEEQAPSEKEWRAFRAEMRVLEGLPEERVCHARTLDHFEEWYRLAGDIERRRTMLKNLEALPGGCLCRFPKLLPDLQGPRSLAHEAFRGRPLWTGNAVGKERRDGLSLLAEGLVEQSLLLSLIDAECRPELYLALPDGGLGFGSLPTWSPVPVEWHYELIQYMASTVAGQSPRALHMLSRISGGNDPYAGEQRLMRELSGLQPELKVNQITPVSVTALENYWRALSLTRMPPPPFLELFHRQWTILGQLNGEIAPAEDLIADALWPVLGRVLRLRFSEIAIPEKTGEWAVNTGLMMLTAARQMSMVFEQARDNDIAMVIDSQEDEPRNARLNRRTAGVIRSLMALALMAGAAWLGFETRGGPLQAAAITAGAISAAALVYFIARID